MQLDLCHLKVKIWAQNTDTTGYEALFLCDSEGSFHALQHCEGAENKLASRGLSFDECSFECVMQSHVRKSMVAKGGFVAAHHCVCAGTESVRCWWRAAQKEVMC